MFVIYIDIQTESSFSGKFFLRSNAMIAVQQDNITAQLFPRARCPLRIAQLAPLYESVPPKLYGGTERIVAYLAEELLRRGHEVTLFASKPLLTAPGVEFVGEITDAEKQEFLGGALALLFTIDWPEPFA